MRTPVPPVEDDVVVQAEFDAPNLDRAALAEAGADEQEPTWSPSDPAARGRAFCLKNPDAQIDVVFPTVYEEDRSAKITDMVTAQSVDVFTHRRMAQQVAEELGFQQYDYDQEQAQIQREKQRRDPGPSAVGAADDLAAVEPFREHIARLDRALDRLTEVVRALPPPIRVTMPETPAPDVLVNIPPVPAPTRTVKDIIRDARGLITRIVEREP